MFHTRRYSAVLTALFLSAVASPVLAADYLNGLDANHDGKVSRDEAANAQTNAFRKLDGNHDGSLSQAEFAASQPPLPKNAKPAEKRRQQIVLHRWFVNMDSDDNGGISQSEYLHAVAPYFDRLDNNHDGVLDARELQSAVAKPSAEKDGN